MFAGFRFPIILFIWNGILFFVIVFLHFVKQFTHELPFFLIHLPMSLCKAPFSRLSVSLLDVSMILYVLSRQIQVELHCGNHIFPKRTDGMETHTHTRRRTLIQLVFLIHRSQLIVSSNENFSIILIPSIWLCYFLAWLFLLEPILRLIANDSYFSHSHILYCKSLIFYRNGILNVDWTTEHFCSFSIIQSFLLIWVDFYSFFHRWFVTSLNSRHFKKHTHTHTRIRAHQ